MSDKAIRGLKPEVLWRRFYEISQIPRPSKGEAKILQHLTDTAGGLGLETKRDSVGNIVVSVPAKPGCENAKTVVLQSHVDMVCEKKEGADHDFDKDPIRLVRENGWIRADGTTLGSDNGIGIAASLAIPTDEDVAHGPLELLFTVEEEVGMGGTSALGSGFITGGTLLNLDSEEEGSFYVGCAGGQDTVGIFKTKEMSTPTGMAAFELVVKGLKGGHSGLNIQEGRANAIKLLGRLLRKLDVVDYQVAAITGGSKRNAIPREAQATILFSPSDVETVKSIVNRFREEALGEYEKTDGGLEIELVKREKDFDRVFARDLVAKLVNVILALPHGVTAMSPDIPDLVETSTNLAAIVMDKDEIRIETSQRSSIESARAYVASSVESLFELADAEVSSSGEYSGWKPNLNSDVLRVCREVYQRLFNREPEVKAVHAGLECGILGDKYPGLDMVSLGPTIQGAHTPDEKVSINAVESFYDLLKGILLELAVRKD